MENSPVCEKSFPGFDIENHVEGCLTENITNGGKDMSSKRIFPFGDIRSDITKKLKIEENTELNSNKNNLMGFGGNFKSDRMGRIDEEHVPLAEKLRPFNLEGYIGQEQVIGHSTVLWQLLEKQEITSMILWGPPGCGKTSLANVIAEIAKHKSQTRFIKLSATSSGIADVREAVITAEKGKRNGCQTIVFMDEIHRFNKLQQDIFLPHVEAGTFILIGATTENPSFSLNSALLSRCRVFPLEKLKPEDIEKILIKGVMFLGGRIKKSIHEEMEVDSDFETRETRAPEFEIENKALEWLVGVCNGDARIAISSLELAVKLQESKGLKSTIRLEDLKISLEEAHTLSEKNSGLNIEMVSALHKCIVDSNANGALYWLARLMAAKEDPVIVAKRLVRIASEEIGFADSYALETAVHTMHGCQMIGMPECDVLLGQCVVYLCKAPKSYPIDFAFRKAQKIIMEHKGPQSSVPMFVRDVSSQRKLQAPLGQNLVQVRDHSRDCLRDSFDEFGSNFS